VRQVSSPAQSRVVSNGQTVAHVQWAADVQPGSYQRGVGMSSAGSNLPGVPRSGLSDPSRPATRASLGWAGHAGSAPQRA
jgi:hypothetical protein